MRYFLRNSIAAVIASFTCAGANPAYSDETTASLSEIVRRVTDWRDSFASLQVTWEVRSLPESDSEVVDWSAPPEPESARLFARDEWIWADHGLDLFEHRAFYWTEGAVGVHTKEVFNGPKGTVFRASFRKPPGGAEQLDQLELSGLGTGKPTSRISRGPMDGLYSPGTATWLPEILTSWNWKVESVDEVCGNPCVRISGRHPESTDVSSVHILWLDLNHDCLVRRYRRPVKGGFDFIVDEFQQLQNGIWFPKRGRRQLNSTPYENHLIVVTEAYVNQPVDLARLEPPALEVGTVVNDGHGRIYRYGVAHAPSVPNANRDLVDPTTTVSPLSAAPPSFNWLWYSGPMLCVSILLVLLGFRLQARK